MDEMMKNGIPLEAITRCLEYEKVLTEYRKAWETAKEIATVPGKTDDEIFADTMMAAAYRIYLLGVEDGMKGVAK